MRLILYKLYFIIPFISEISMDAQVITEEPSTINHTVWGSKGQPAYPVNISLMVSAEWNEYLDMLASDAVVNGSIGGLIAKARWTSSKASEVSQSRLSQIKF